MQVVILRRDLFEKRSAEHPDQRLKFAVAKTISFLRAPDGVILAIWPRRQFNLVSGKNFQPPQARIAGKQFVHGHRGSGGKSQCMVQQRRLHPQRWLAKHLNDLRLTCTVPILQRGFQVAVKEIDGRQELIGILITGIEPQRPAQLAPGTVILLLLECHTGKFYWETLVSRRKPPAGGQRLPRLFPALLVRQRDTIVIAKIGGSARGLLQELYQFGPALLFKKLLGLFGKVGL